MLKLKVLPEGIGRKLAVELWIYPDGSRILELSTKCAPDEALRAATESRDFLSSIGLTCRANRRPRPARRSSTSPV